MSKKEKQPTCLGNCADCTCESLKPELHPATFREGFMYQTRAVYKRDIATLGRGYTAVDEGICRKRMPPNIVRTRGIAILDERPPRYLFPNHIAAIYLLDWAFPDIPTKDSAAAAEMIERGLGLEVSEDTCKEVFTEEEMCSAYRIIYDDPQVPRSYFVPSTIISLPEVATRIKGEELPNDINYPWLPRERKLIKALIGIICGNNVTSLNDRLIEAGYSSLVEDILKTTIQDNVSRALAAPLTLGEDSPHNIFGKWYNALRIFELHKKDFEGQKGSPQPSEVVEEEPPEVECVEAVPYMEAL